ncbi:MULTISPECIES: GNAT family N-acetyltransferase [Streptomyces]|uniref:N-acetyltransferase n=1 Tax=Streptomyces lycii TaxID=2654337 RepID=A0ABQ7FHD8_9ACTN|nr:MULTISPECIES: N-acetyltransferase [Streptomyces]KAF4408342.1 N-acetyltransferase [Streptomyces lycii]PGH51916.1 GNAT family N-acetyltransferase [Streptomyces sp. Ru87]
MLIRRERPADAEAVRAVHTAAFAAGDGQPGREPVEAGLVDALRADDGWIPELSLVATGDGGVVTGHVVCTRARVGSAPALGLGPLGVLPRSQRQGIGEALMHAVLGAADALGEPLVVLLGHTGYYPRFGFRPAAEYGITPPDPAWAGHFQARALTAYRPSLRGEFVYAKPFRDL